MYGNKKLEKRNKSIARDHIERGVSKKFLAKLHNVSYQRIQKIINDYGHLYETKI